MQPLTLLKLKGLAFTSLLLIWEGVRSWATSPNGRLGAIIKPTIIMAAPFCLFSAPKAICLCGLKKRGYNLKEGVSIDIPAFTYREIWSGPGGKQR